MEKIRSSLYVPNTNLFYYEKLFFPNGYFLVHSQWDNTRSTYYLNLYTFRARGTVDKDSNIINKYLTRSQYLGTNYNNLYVFVYYRQSENKAKMGLPYVTSFCCCLGLETGAKVIAYVHTVRSSFPILVRLSH